MKELKFADRSSIEFVEEGSKLAPKFNQDGVIPVVVTESKSDLVLMLGYMNKEALDKSILTRELIIGAEAEKLCGRKVSPAAWFIRLMIF